MNKVEELKLKRIIEFIRSNKTTESDRLEMLQQYANEVSQEVAEKAEEFLRDKKTSLFPGLKVYTFKEVCELLDEYAKQGERKGFDEGFNKA